MKTLFTLLLATLCPLVSALETNNPDLRLNGFGTLGLTKADNKYLGQRNNVSDFGVFGSSWTPDLETKLGLQLDYSASDMVDIGLQVLLKDRPDNSIEKSIQWAYVGIDLNPNLELRLGRMANDIYMLSEYRQAGFAQLWAHPPTEFYGHVSSEYADGIGLIDLRPIQQGLLRTRIMFSRSKYAYYLGTNIKATYRPSISVSTSWESEVWQLRATYSQAKLHEQNQGLDPFYDTLRGLEDAGWGDAKNIADALDGDSYLTRYVELGASYDHDGWIIQSELSLIKTNLESANDFKTAYALVGKRFGKLTPYISFSTSENDRITVTNTPPAFAIYGLSAQQIANQYHSDQKTLGLGLRWDLSHRVALKAQWDRTEVAPYGGFLTEQIATQNSKQVLNRYTITLDFLF